MFPRDFKYGFSESGFQFEMGISEPDHNSDWYIWAHDPRNISSHYVSGDFPEQGVGYWDMYKTDHSLAKSIGMNSGRLGVEWSRIFPESTEGVHVNAEVDGEDVLSVDISLEDLEQLDKLANKGALEHYRKIFEDFKSRNNFLIVNLYHWTIPKWLNDPSKVENNGGLRTIRGSFNAHMTVEFSKYSAYIAWKFDSLVDMWTTMNEPNMVFLWCEPDRTDRGTAYRRKNFAEAHARSYDSIRKFSKKPIGIIYANGDAQPLKDSDSGAVEKFLFDGRYSFFDSIVKGDLSWYNDLVDSSSFPKTDDYRKDMNNKMDWIGVNYYSRDVLTTNGNGWSIVEGYGHSAGNREKSLGDRSISDTGWEIYPEGIYNVLMSYKERYNLPMMITENGIADAVDKFRPRYLVSHIFQIEKAINDGANVKGYLHWALTDNYEWGNGFSKKFGLYGVDYKTKERQLRPSALIFREIVANQGVPDSLMWMVDTKI